MASPVKVLVCGDISGSLDDLFARVSTVNAKAGPFSCLFCVGEVCAFPPSQHGDSDFVRRARGTARKRHIGRR